MTINDIILAVQSENLAPFVFWNPAVTGGGGAPLACPQRTGPNLHLHSVSFATPAGDDHYTPTIGLDIDPATGGLQTDAYACMLHGGQNRGTMLAISYWCESGCGGRIELREHKRVMQSTVMRSGRSPAS